MKHMKKFYALLMFAALAVFVFTMSGCGGSNKSLNNGTVRTSGTVKEVAVLSSPAFERDKEYLIYRGSELTGMEGAQYYIANVGSEANKATLNLGFLSELGADDTLVFVENSTGNVVFAYDPAGTEGSALTAGTVKRTGGKRLSYNGLTSTSAAFFTAMAVDTSSAKKIVLNGSTATYEDTTVNVYDYVWHADPDHADEYYTEGLNGTTEYTKKQMKANITDDVYIAHDVVYMPSGLEYTSTVKNDDESEYAAYYSSAVQSEVAAELVAQSGDAFGGPYIFATLPGSMGMPNGGGNGGPGGDFTPPNGGGDFTPPDGGNGGPGGGGERPTFPSANVSASSYNDQISSTISSMTHTSADAYANPVLHITKAGTYSLQGTWNGQIWIDVGEDEGDTVAVILNGVDVTCTVAPAIVFHDLYECGPDDEDDVAAASMDVGKDLLDNAGAMVVIADGTTNNFTGSNVYRMLKPQIKKASVTAMDGTDVSQQKKRYKMDGAFYSFVSLAIGGGTNADGVLNIKSSTYEGFDTEMHLTVESGTITVYAPDDAINVNEDDVSVFTMLGGSMTITSENGDGIDSNGYVVILGGSLDITAGSQSIGSAGESGIDSEKGTYVASSVNYAWHSISGNGGNGGGNGGGNNNPTPPTSGDNNVPTPPTSGDNNVPTPPTSGDNNVPTPPTSGDNTVPTPPTSGDNTVPTPPTSGDNNVPTPPTSGDNTVPTPPTSGDNTVPTPPTPETPDEYVVPEDADESFYLETDTGTTVVNIGKGSTTSFIEEDTDTSPRNIPTSGYVFPLKRKVNTFWRIQ